MSEPAAWSKIPPMVCKGLCAESCGPIDASPQEKALLAMRGIQLAPIAEAVTTILLGGDFYCPALKDGRCTVYDVRPTVCRLWGVVEGMPCPWGCEPEGGRLPDMIGQAILANSLNEP